MKFSNKLLLSGLAIAATFLSGCSSSKPSYTYKKQSYNPSTNTYATGQSYGPLTKHNNYSRPQTQPRTLSYSQPPQAPSPTVAKRYDTQAAPYDAFSQSYGQTDRNKLSQLYRAVNVNLSILSSNSRSRTKRHMTPKYITIHSTQNRSEGADAWKHAAALRNGALGRIGWHYSTDEARAVQHIPLNEQGNHAENYRGPGNKYSIGIEMCENAGNNIPQTIDRTAKLTAYLMHKHNIPLSNVKPHYHWPRTGFKVANKNCPHFLLDNGRPGRKWQNYLNLVDRYYKSATSRSNLAYNR